MNIPFERRTTMPVDWDKIDVPSTSIQCPYCRATAHFTPLTHAWSSRPDAWIIQKCDACNELVLTVFQSTGFVSVSPGEGTIAQLKPEPEKVFPYFLPTPDASIPKEIAEDYSEAVLCFSAGAFDASVVMSRRAIETSAILLGANPNDLLVDKLRYLASKGLERGIVELATEIRLLGNVPAAHPDKGSLLRKVQPEECKIVLDFLEAFLDSLYVRPAKMRKLREKRTEKP